MWLAVRPETIHLCRSSERWKTGTNFTEGWAYITEDTTLVYLWSMMVSTGTVPTTPRMLVPTNVHQLPLSSTSERISLSLLVVWNILTDKHNMKHYQRLALAPQACLVCLSLDHKVNQSHDAPSPFSLPSAPNHP